MTRGEFKVTKDGFTANCNLCLLARHKRFVRQKEADKNKENLPTTAPSDADHEDDPEDFSQLTELSLDAFLNAITDAEKFHSLSARVDVSSLTAEGPKDLANSLAKAIWDRLQYRFV